MSGRVESSSSPRVITGIDWSGDAGDPARTPGRSPLLIFVAAHVEETLLPDLRGAMDEVRRARQLPERFTFRYSECRPQIREAWFAVVSPVPLTATALVVDKSGWSDDWVRRTAGDERLRHGLLRLVLGMPPKCVSGQRLLVDYPSRERRKVEEIARAVAREHRSLGIETFSTVRPCPDHRGDGATVQAADMIAGALRDIDRSGSAYLAGFGGRLHMLER